MNLIHQDINLNYISLPNKENSSWQRFEKIADANHTPSSFLRRRTTGPIALFLAIVLTAVFSFSDEITGSSDFLSWKLRGSKSNELFSTLSELDKINSKLDQMDLGGVLQWSYKAFGDQLVDVTSFGASGMIILHKLQELNLLDRIDVVTIDTLHLFPETYTFIDQIVNSFKIDKFFKYTPKTFSSKIEFDKEYGDDLWKTQPDQYNYLSKVEPTLRALNELNVKAWFTGRRRDQGGERKNIRILELDSYNRYKVNPLANWSYEDMWDYIKKNAIPYNPLYDKGYKSIGDYMTTAPVNDNAAERSGRFVGLDHTECGIHSTREKIKRMKEEAKKAGREFDGIVSLPCPECTYEITPDNFDDIVLNSKNTLLIELYSPMCGGCVEFAPVLNQIVHVLGEKGIETGRYDVTEHDVPEAGREIGIEITDTPDLYILKRNGGGGDLNLVHFDGEHELQVILKWISKEVGMTISV